MDTINRTQFRAIVRLEKAMARIEASGLLLAGVDNRLVAFTAKQFRELSDKREGPALGPAQIINELDHAVIDCPYIDSGGA